MPGPGLGTATASPSQRSSRTHGGPAGAANATSATRQAVQGGMTDSRTPARCPLVQSTRPNLRPGASSGDLPRVDALRCVFAVDADAKAFDVLTDLCRRDR